MISARGCCLQRLRRACSPGVSSPVHPAGLSATEFRQANGVFFCHDLRRAKGVSENRNRVLQGPVVTLPVCTWRAESCQHGVGLLQMTKTTDVCLFFFKRFPHKLCICSNPCMEVVALLRKCIVVVDDVCSSLSVWRLSASYYRTQC